VVFTTSTRKDSIVNTPNVVWKFGMGYTQWGIKWERWTKISSYIILYLRNSAVYHQSY